MRPLSSWPRAVLRTLAGLFAGAVTLYSAVWMYSARRAPAVYMGIDNFLESRSSILVEAVEEGGPAARAGLEAGDRVVAVDGRPLVTIEPFAKALFGGHPGERVRLAGFRASP